MAEVIRTIVDNYREIAASPQNDQLANRLGAIKRHWLGQDHQDLTPHFTDTSREELTVARSDLFLPNGYVGVIRVDGDEVTPAFYSRRADDGLSGAKDPIMADCLKIGFLNYPNMLAVKALFAAAYGNRPHTQAGFDYYAWSGALFGSPTSGGSAHHAKGGNDFYVGATGMVHNAAVMEALAVDPVLAAHFEDEAQESFRCSGGADQTVADSFGQRIIPTAIELRQIYRSQVERGINLN